MADVVMSVHAFLFARDKRAGFVELAWVLRPGGRLALTSWDYSSQPRGRPPQVPDHRPLVEDAGLRVLVYEQTKDWHKRCCTFADSLLEEAAAEAEQPLGALRLSLEEMRDSMEQMTRRLLLLAEKPLA